MAKVKGSILLGFVKIVRSDKNGILNKYLTDKDREIISGRILATAWYPMETYMNLFNAMLEEGAKDDLNLVLQWGRNFADNYYRYVYKHLFKKTDPKTAFKDHEAMYRTLYDSVSLKAEEVSGNEAIVAITSSVPLPEAFFHLVMGVTQRRLELVGGNDVKFEFLTKVWEGAPSTRIKISWESWDTPP